VFLPPATVDPLKFYVSSTKFSFSTLARQETFCYFTQPEQQANRLPRCIASAKHPAAQPARLKEKEMQFICSCLEDLC
jgi:hypothetical protein